jgi:2-keto-4-pentenoate hydratase/2-oxohepta-3-ene-1,7-dioic acid hydratase in catechol pathway
MRLCRYDAGRLGLVDGDRVFDVTAALDALPTYRYPLPAHDVMVAQLAVLRPRIQNVAAHAAPIPLREVTLRSPIANPGKIIAAPVNYQTHLQEVRTDPQLHHGNPSHTVTIHSAGVFLKASSSMTGAGDGVVICKPERRTDHEVELACIIGRTTRGVAAKDALASVAGYAIGLDITIRGGEDRSLRKSPDSYSVLGPWLVTADEIADPGALDLEIAVNGEVRQRSNTGQMILGVAELIELASSFYTLHPGDIIFTGTPDGVGPIVAGDRLTASISGIGSMEVQVRGH